MISVTGKSNPSPPTYIGDSKVEHKTSNIKITKEIFLAGTYNIQINKDYIYSIYTISGLGLINSKIVKDNDFIKCEDLEYLTIDAQNNLGAMYFTGEGVNRDEKEAIKWFEKAASQGNSDAQANLDAIKANQ